MADIGGLGGFDVATQRSAFDQEAAAQRRAEERARQEEVQEQRRTEASQEEARRTEETDTEQESAAQNQTQEELQEDTVTLSNAAERFVVEAENAETAAANDDALAAVQQADAVSRTTQVGGVNGSNQDTADEENSSTVNGNQDSQSEQTRALGQIVDQFA